VRLVLCDGHQLFAEPLAFALERRGHRVVVTTTLLEAVRAVDDDEPDTCLLDLGFPHEDGLEALAALRRRHPLCAVLVLSSSNDARVVEAARLAGAAGFVRKDQPLAALFVALARLAAGREPPPPPPVEQRGHDRGRAHRLVGELTRREREVLGCLVRAEDTVAIARSLGVATSTARTHLQSVLRKLEVNNRLQAVALAADAGLEWDR
jgi:two-component system nitrate/nitrite response regulator NarL